MPTYFNVNVGTQPRPSHRRGIALLSCVLLLAGAIFMVCVNFDFARYAVTWFRWTQTEGTVTNPAKTTSPTIQFATEDGVTHSFTEDYVLLCGTRSSFCFIRSFDPGQTVPVVYDPGTPQRAFVHDWALFAGVIQWFAGIGCGLIIALMLAAWLSSKPLSVSFEVGSGKP